MTHSVAFSLHVTITSLNIYHSFMELFCDVFSFCSAYGELLYFLCVFVCYCADGVGCVTEV